MSQTSRNIEKIKKFPIKNGKTLENIIKRVKQIINGKREIMYSDIINSTLAIVVFAMYPKTSLTLNTIGGAM